MKAQNIKQELKNTKTSYLEIVKKQKLENANITKKKKRKKKTSRKQKQRRSYCSRLCKTSKKKKKKKANITKPYNSLAVPATQSEIELPNKYVLRPKIRTC